MHFEFALAKLYKMKYLHGWHISSDLHKAYKCISMLYGDIRHNFNILKKIRIECISPDHITAIEQALASTVSKRGVLPCLLKCSVLETSGLLKMHIEPTDFIDGS